MEKISARTLIGILALTATGCASISPSDDEVKKKTAVALDVPRASIKFEHQTEMGRKRVYIVRLSNQKVSSKSIQKKALNDMAVPCDALVNALEQVATMRRYSRFKEFRCGDKKL